MADDQDLENLVENGGFLRTLRTQTREYAVDTSISLMYSNVVYGAGEYFLSGMDTEEFIKTRIGMSILGTFIYRPYTKFREFWANLWNADAESSGMKKFLTDTSCNITFFVPIYSTIMHVSGASLDEIGVALGTGTLMATATARPYGFVLDKWRKAFGVKPTLSD